MLKSMSKKEVKIVFNTEFLADYYSHLMEHPNSILSKYLGIYCFKIDNQTPFYFLIT